MRRLLLVLAAFFSLSIGPAFAGGEFSAYDKAKLQAAIQSGGPVVVHVHAAWCTVCQRQTSVLEKIFADPSLASVQTIRVNYDKDRDFIADHQVKRQANILVFKGGKEVARVDYNASEDRIRAAVAHAR